LPHKSLLPSRFDQDYHESIKNHLFEIEIAYSNPENELEEKTNKNHLNRALERVSSDNRELLILSKFTELPYNQIAEIFGCRVGAIKVRIYRAMKELKVQYLNIAGE
jgi:RNA polymerase sigma factor (sigma-70 family)